MKVMPARGWNSGETPVAPAGLRVQAFATGFLHPRIVYPLPNGDVLIVESNGPKAPVYRPKDYIEGKIKALSGSGAPGGQRISLLDRDGDGMAFAGFNLNYFSFFTACLNFRLFRSQRAVSGCLIGPSRYLRKYLN
jgi:glucose/arabinose dehydrogenase